MLQKFRELSLESFTLPLVGGLLLGASAMWLLLSVGRIAGISGVIWGALAGPERSWRWMFLIGLLLGGVITHFVIGKALPDPSRTPMWIVAVSGLLVGMGTRMGGGCTSGHGVCGLGQRSPRSAVATLTFMALGIITVAVMQMMSGGAP